MPDKGDTIIKIDDMFRAMWNSRSISVAEIAAFYGCSTCTVNEARKRAGLPSRKSGRLKTGPAPRSFVSSPPPKPKEPAPPRAPRAAMQHPDFPLERDAAIMATGGAYDELRKLAARWGLPEKRVNARYLLVR